MRAMILAAGRGERMRPLTDTMPKPLLAVAGQPLIVYHLEALVRAGIREVVINLGWQGARLREYLQTGTRWGAQITYSEEGWPALETGGGICNALPLLGAEPFLVINGDIWTDWCWSQQILTTFWHSDTLAHLILVANPAHHLQGDFALHNGYVRAPATPAAALPGSATTYTFSGIGVYHPDLFANCTTRVFKLAPLLYAAAQQGRVTGSVYAGRWYDIGTVQRLEALSAQLLGEGSAG